MPLVISSDSLERSAPGDLASVHEIPSWCGEWLVTPYLSLGASGITSLLGHTPSIPMFVTKQEELPMIVSSQPTGTMEVGGRRHLEASFGSNSDQTLSDDTPVSLSEQNTLPNRGVRKRRSRSTKSKGPRQAPFNHQCPNCTSLFDSPKDLRRHLNTVHLTSPIRYFCPTEWKCKHAISAFLRKDNFFRHERGVHDLEDTEISRKLVQIHERTWTLKP
jgi:hypothetical protein